MTINFSNSRGKGVRGQSASKVPESRQILREIRSPNAKHVSLLRQNHFLLEPQLSYKLFK